MQERLPIFVPAGDQEGGVYQLGYANVQGLITSLQQSGNSVFRLEGAGISTQADYLQALSQVFDFGDYFGQNWDALWDCLTDFEWGEGDRCIVFYSNADNFQKNDPEAWDMALEIWDEAIEWWAEQGVRLQVVLVNENSD